MSNLPQWLKLNIYREPHKFGQIKVSVVITDQRYDRVTGQDYSYSQVQNRVWLLTKAMWIQGVAA